MNNTVLASHLADSDINIVDRTFLKELKEQTTPQHRELDSLVPLMRSDINEAKLALYLQRIASFHYGFEHHLESSFPGVLKQWQFRSRATLIGADLKVLNAETNINHRDSFDWPSVNFSCAAVLAGWLYVQEGSALGGALIHRHLCQYLGVERASSLHFFRPNGDNPGMHWRDFQSRLGNVAQASEKAQQHIITAAKQAFTWYKKAVMYESLAAI